MRAKPFEDEATHDPCPGVVRCERPLQPGAGILTARLQDGDNNQDARCTQGAEVDGTAFF